MAMRLNNLYLRTMFELMILEYAAGYKRFKETWVILLPWASSLLYCGLVNPITGVQQALCAYKLPDTVWSTIITNRKLQGLGLNKLKDILELSASMNDWSMWM